MINTTPVNETRRISIAGAGLAGTLLAIMLAKRGYRVDLFERFEDMRKRSIPAGRSINLALAERGREALRAVDLLEAVDTFTIPMRGRMLHDGTSEPVLQPYGASEKEVNYSVHRTRLNETLLDAADATGRIRCYFDHALQSVDFDRQSMRFQNQAGEAHEHPFEVLIGADGGGSRVRKAMIDGANLGLIEDLLDHGYKELGIDPDASGDFRIDPHALHIWPRGGHMMIALPNADKSFTVTLFLANEGDPEAGQPGFDQLTTWEQQRAFLETEFPDAMAYLADAKADFANNPVGLLGTIRCDRWQLNGKVLLIGDAAHAIVPFHGQGMNAAFEDCSVLTDLLDANPEQSWDQLFKAFEQQRRPDAEAIAQMALENYHIMRAAVRDPKFLLRKAVEHELERRHPGHFVARYSLVMFHTLPYSAVLARGNTQAQLLDELLEGSESLETVDWSHAEQLIHSRLTPIQE